jgi:hypothetical protein
VFYDWEYFKKKKRKINPENDFVVERVWAFVPSEQNLRITKKLPTILMLRIIIFFKKKNKKK